jgi:SMODS domain-containing protein
MATTVPKAFDEFSAKLNPTDAQESMLATRRTAVEGYLKDSFGAGSNMPLTTLRIIGSAGRKTLIRPVDDLDVFAVFDDSQVWDTYRLNSQKLITRVRNALSGYSIQTVGTRGQAVRLFYTSGPNVDITPAFPVGNPLLGGVNGYVIPAGDGSWVRTDPYEHHDFMAARNQELGGHLKPLVRKLKRWNNVHSKRLKSFHLEMLTQRSFSSMNGNSRSALEMFFYYAGVFLHVNDPAGYSGDLASGLTANQEQAIKQSFSTAYNHVLSARAAESRGDVTEACRQWRIVFGNEFPAYG